MRRLTSPRQAACLIGLAAWLAACAIASPDSLPRAGTQALTPAPTAGPPTAAASAEPGPGPSPTPAPALPRVSVAGRFASAPEGSVPALTLAGLRAAASAEGAVFQLQVVDLDAPPGADPDAALRRAADGGDALIVVAGADLADAARRAALAYPSTLFVGVDQPEAGAPANLYIVGGSGTRADEEGFLAGALAGYVTQARIVGIAVVGATREGKLYTNGFTHGLRYACGDCKLWVIELENAHDVEAGARSATRLRNVKVDVMFAAAGAAGDAGLAAGAAQGLWVIGTGRDYARALRADADRALASILRRPDLSVPALVASLLAGEKRDSPIPFSLANGNLTPADDYGPDVSPAVIDLMDDLISRTASGALDTGVDPATGEIK